MVDLKIFNGAEVHHKTWGQGKIESICSESVIVHFEKTNVGERSVSFQFPTSFVQGYLFFDDSNLNEELKKVIEDSMCHFCKKTDIQTKKISGYSVCQKCEKEHFAICSQCNKSIEKGEIQSVAEERYSYKKIIMCKECLRSHAFICENCNENLLKTTANPIMFENRMICEECFSQIASNCFVCKKAFNISKGEEIFSYEHSFVDVCPSCIENNTFVCSNCDSTRLIQDKVRVGRIKSNQNICRFCVHACSNCNEIIDEKQLVTHLGKKYCLQCWGKLSKECTMCGETFIPSEDQDVLCKECVEMKRYETRVQGIDFKTCEYKEITYNQLEYVNRCRLFTELYEFCDEKPFHIYGQNASNPYKFIVLSLYGRKLIITYLKDSVVGNVRCSANITMTELRSRKGRMKIYDAINEWKETSTETINTIAGKMTILNYPILLRVQTDYDKTYGKEWDGPYGYTEIGNYGDATSFYIIGMIE